MSRDYYIQQEGDRLSCTYQGLSEIGSDTMDAENESVPEGGFMATFRTAVQRAYDSVGDPEKEGVQEGDLTNILSKLGYSSEDRETQNILSAAANRADKSSMKFQDIFKLVVGKNEEETISDITNAFEIFDRDDDGRLQTKDLHRALTRIGDDPLTEEEFEEILFLAEIDPDFESFFDYKELTNHKLALSYSSSSNKKSPNPEENYMNWTALNACAKFKQIVLEQLKEETEDVFEDALDYENDMRISHEKEGKNIEGYKALAEEYENQLGTDIIEYQDLAEEERYSNLTVEEGRQVVEDTIQSILAKQVDLAMTASLRGHNNSCPYTQRVSLLDSREELALEISKEERYCEAYFSPEIYVHLDEGETRRSKEALSEEGGYHGSPDFSSSEQLKSSKSDSNYLNISDVAKEYDSGISLEALYRSNDTSPMPSERKPSFYAMDYQNLPSTEHDLEACSEEASLLQTKSVTKSVTKGVTKSVTSLHSPNEDEAYSEQCQDYSDIVPLIIESGILNDFEGKVARVSDLSMPAFSDSDDD